MTVRSAESDDREQIRAIARDSLQSSYSLSPDQIEMILEEEFDDTALTDLLDDSETTVLVVEETVDNTETVRGFITVEIGTEATIRWLHVDPTARGGGIATALLERVREQYADKPIAACILDEAVEGGEFLEGFGLKQGDHDHLLVGGEEFAVTMFTEGQSTQTPTEPTVTVPESVTVDGVELSIDRDDSVPGSEAPVLHGVLYGRRRGGVWILLFTVRQYERLYRRTRQAGVRGLRQHSPGRRVGRCVSLTRLMSAGSPSTNSKLFKR